MELLITTLLFSVGFNLAMFVPAYLFKTDKLTDFSYSLTFIAISIFLFINSDQNLVHQILLIMILLWATRLGTCLFIRISKTGKDSRFDEMRENFWKFLSFWLLQGVSVWIIMLASTVSFGISDIQFSKIHILGIAVWFIGLLIESVADYQKFKFKNNPENRGQWTDVGLWSRSRHPNYFGEMLIWVGIFIYSSIYSTLPYILIEIISPIYIIILLLFVSGVPILEKRYNEKYGNDPEYKKYKENTNLVILK